MFCYFKIAGNGTKAKVKFSFNFSYLFKTFKMKIIRSLKPNPQNL